MIFTSYASNVIDVNANLFERKTKKTPVHNIGVFWIIGQRLRDVMKFRIRWMFARITGPRNGGMPRPMAHATTYNVQALTVSDEAVLGPGVASYNGRHALPPILIGLMTPVILLLLYDPRALGSASIIMYLILMAAFVISATIFVSSLLNPGSIIAVTFDPVSGTAHFVSEGSFAHSVNTIPLRNIMRVRMVARYDHDGYSWHQAIAELRSGETISLPASTTSDQVAALNELLRRR